mmetsp:Transcript_42459/g.48238  ORF Transcript_42459/g.48238 Transcript_42459/m.48238 type:complete len:90 (-) Transcript_42459:507-776(-)
MTTYAPAWQASIARWASTSASPLSYNMAVAMTIWSLGGWFDVADVDDDDNGLSTNDDETTGSGWFEHKSKVMVSSVPGLTVAAPATGAN